MGFDFFGWLRRKVRDAVLGGLADAAEELSPGEPSPDLDRLRALLAAPEPRGVLAEVAAGQGEGEEPAPAKRARAK